MATPNTTPIPCRVRRHSRRAAAAVALSGVAAFTLAVTGNAFAGGSNSVSDSSAGIPDAAAQAAKVAPVAGSGPSDTTVSEAQPSASIDPPIAQPTSSETVPSLDTATQQAATAVAGATQNNVQNIIVIIRINSPGDDVISQSNTAVAGAVAGNTATTQQGSGASAPAHKAEPVQPSSTTTNGTSAGGSPALCIPPTPPPAEGAPAATTSPPRVAAAAGPERARPRVVPRGSGGRADRTRQASDAPRPAATGVRTPKVAPRQVAAAAQRSASAPSSRKSRPSVTSVPARLGRAAARAGTGAAHFVSSSAPNGTLPVNTADSISTPVILTLLAVILAVVLSVGSTYVPSLRALRARVWR
jgi:hypothetical protein